MRNILESISTIKNFMANASRTTCNEYLYEALQVAVECMEKQIAMEPEYRKSEISGEYYKCSGCGRVVGQRTPYCRICGQRIEWYDDKITDRSQIKLSRGKE